jgi:hypothetical protein
MAILPLMMVPPSAATSPIPCQRGKMADLYAAAALAVVGTIQGTAANGIDLRLTVARVIKGRAMSVVLLRGQRPVGTEYNGFTFTSDRRFLSS